MKRGRKRLAVPAMLISAGAFALALLGCQQPTSTTQVQTIQWQPDGAGNIEFLTNDTQYYGYVFWDANTSVTEPTGGLWTSPVIAAMTKKSGAVGTGFGLVFCYQTNGNFYFVEISANGGYKVGEYVSSTKTFDWISGTASNPWVQSAAINQGGGVANTISVSYNGSQFSIDINSSMSTPFTFAPGGTYNGTAIDSYTGGTAGFIIDIGSSSIENFPTTPEDVVYKLTSPTAYP